MFRSKAVNGVATALLATAVLSGCGGSEPQDEGICMQMSTFLRAEDDQCPDEDGGGGSSGHGWIFYPRSSSVHHPPVGGRVSPGYSTVMPAGGFIRGNVPRVGGFGTHKGTVVS